MLENVVSELRARKGTWEQISRDIPLPYHWLTKVAQGKIANPGIRRIELLAEYFAETRKDEDKSEAAA